MLLALHLELGLKWSGFRRRLLCAAEMGDGCGRPDAGRGEGLEGGAGQVGAQAMALSVE